MYTSNTIDGFCLRRKTNCSLLAPTCPQHFPVRNMGMFSFMAFTQIINFSEIARTSAASLSAPSEPLPKTT